ncbi:metal-sensitive transcriptional regulator [Tessaracoccus sp. OS52]|uniref:metal-sensitive transcriptional regulator n=1 Tax=Tessaracoccus sp. OS52 TaxID=2886691 RepID=UPI001D0FD69B|nr:metal-sensitive transcriptional regulator [Tessaracoccus sp. OS52]MCC2592508.1 metal-sensitive transcriptional regulator [Tessaracoccus sp. OS52]
MPETGTDRDALVTRLNRIEGQVRGITRMIGRDAYCIETLTQISAASSALRSVALALLEDHIQHCLAEAVQSGDHDFHEAKVVEASEAIGRLLRS